MTWGNLSPHLSKLEEAGYVDIKKEFIGKKSRTMLKLTDNGRFAFQEYRKSIKMILNGSIEDNLEKQKKKKE